MTERSEATTAHREDERETPEPGCPLCSATDPLARAGVLAEFVDAVVEARRCLEHAGTRGFVPAAAIRRTRT